MSRFYLIFFSPRRIGGLRAELRYWGEGEGARGFRSMRMEDEMGGRGGM